MTAQSELNDTREEILEALNIDYETLKSRFNDLFSELYRVTEKSNLLLTNSIWLNSTMDYKKEGLEDLASF